MRRLIAILVSLLTISALVSGVLWRELRAEREIIANLRALPEEYSPTGLLPLPSVQSVARCPSEMPLPPTPICNSETSQSTLPTEEFIARMEALLTRMPLNLAGVPQERDLLNNSEYRRARITQMRIAEARDNPGLAETLGLSESEANRLFELMAESDLQSSMEISRSSGITGSSAVPDLLDTVRRQGVSQEESVRALLGSTKYEELLEYRRSVRPPLVQVDNIGAMLASAGQPLSNAQSQALRAAIVGVQQRPRQQSVTTSSSLNAPTSRTITQILREGQARQEESNSRLLEAASPYLSDKQLEVLRNQFQLQATQIRKTLDTRAGK